MAMTKEQIIESIEKMSVIELSELVKAIETKFGVSAAPTVVAAGAGAGEASKQSAKEEQTTFSVMLTSAGDKKIQVIKAVREVTSLGLKEAKDLVDGAPKPIKEGISKEEAESIKKKFDGSGATIDIK